MFKRFIANIVKQELQNKKVDLIVKREVSIGDEVEFSIMNSPEDWKIEDHNLIHNKTGMKIWIANGASHVKINQIEEMLTAAEQNRIWAAFVKMKENALLKTFRNSESCLTNIVETNKFLLKRVKELEEELEKMKMKKYMQIGKD